MTIRLKQKETLVNAGYKIELNLKHAIEGIARNEKLTSSEIVRAFLEHALSDYQQGDDVLRVGRENWMDRFRDTLKKGQIVLTKGGIVGKIVDVLDDVIIKISTAEKVTLMVRKDFIMERLENPNLDSDLLKSL